MTDKKSQVDGHAYFIRKPSSNLELMQATLSKHHNFFIEPKPFRIVKTIELSDTEFRKFLKNDILLDQPFLKDNTQDCHVNEYGIWQAIKIVNKDNPTETLLTQTEGYNYARYVAIEDYYPEKLKELVGKHPLKDKQKYMDKLMKNDKERS